MTTRKEPDSKSNQISREKPPGRRLNWPLIVGLLLVTFIIILAFIGPSIAPKDPSEEVNITMINGEWYIPPFDIGTPGYPLGSDNFGRDLYSRLLWGIGPTMIMVVVVAVVRLVMGVIIGLSAGWFTGKTARVLDGLIQVALALPVLLVALGAIALVGVELGIWAFIIGLSLTGWVDTALQVREQTRIVKGQVYIEAASAMGATNQKILSNHVLKQITPMLLMLFAFEISSTLMLTAGLGFLGYYIGGDVWVETDDFVARRISGNPELGQMLATSWVTLTKPWAMVVVGTTVFITVLGFNLIGEGLRQNIGVSKVQSRSIFSEARHKSGLWFDQNIWHPVLQFFRIEPLRLGLIVIAIFFALGFGAILMLDAAEGADVSGVLAQLNPDSTNSLNSTASTEPAATTQDFPAEGQASTISYSPSIDWEYLDESGFTGGLAASQNLDQLYAASTNGVVYAFDLDGNIIWETKLEAGGFGTPAVDELDNILTADKSGGLSKLSPQGEEIWHFQTGAGDRTHSGPAIGPDGTIYYTVGTSAKGFVQAVTPGGEHVWVSPVKTPFFFETPNPSLDGSYIFLKNDIFSPQSGELIVFDFDLNVLRFFSGRDGKNYLSAGQKIIQWEENDGQIEVIDVAEWDSSEFSEFIAPGYVGVDENGTGWLLYTSPGGSTTTIWVTLDDQAIGTSSLGISGSALISMESDLSAFVCGGTSFNSASTDCAVVSPSSDEPLWKYHLGNYGPVAGGIAIDRRLFITTEEGYVFAVSENYQEESANVELDSPSPSASDLSEPGVVWSYQTTEDIRFGPMIGPEGSVYLTTDDDKIHVINSAGEVQSVLQLEKSPYRQTTDLGRSAPLVIAPLILPDATILVASMDNTIYAINNDGDKLWEHELESEPAQFPMLDDDGNYYLVDKNAGLNAFTSDGFRWRYQSDAAKYSANGIISGADGNVYYVATNFSKGFVQAVSSSGEGLWVVQASTRDFYDDLHISHDGMHVSLADNLIDTSSGELIEINSGVKIDEFIFGADGRKYFRSTHKVDEWQIGSSGMEILNEGIVSENDTSVRPPLGSSADSNGIIWLYYPERYTGGGIIVTWMSAEGQLLGSHLLERNFQSIVDYDLNNSILTECKSFEETASIECTAYSPHSEHPLWMVSILNIPPYQWGTFHGDFIYLMGEDNTVTSVFLGEPELSSED